MKTAEEILEKHYKKFKERIAFEDQVISAMKEYASQREEKAFYEGYIQGQNHPDNAVNNKYDYYKQQNPLT